MQRRQLPSSGRAERSQDECLDAILQALHDLRMQAYKPVFEEGRIPEPEAKDFMIAVAALVSAFRHGDRDHLHAAAREGRGYIAREMDRRPDELEPGNERKFIELELPRDLMETRSGTLELLQQILAKQIQEADRKVQDDPELGRESLRSVAALIVEIMSDDPVIALPFLESAPQTTRNAAPSRIAVDYFTESRRAAATEAARRVIESPDRSVDAGTAARQAIEGVLKEFGLIGKPFDFMRQRAGRDKKK